MRKGCYKAGREAPVDRNFLEATLSADCSLRIGSPNLARQDGLIAEIFVQGTKLSNQLNESV